VTTNIRILAVRRPFAAAVAVIAGIAIGSLTSSEAAAQCAQAGSNVSCTGTDPNGFAATTSDLTVTVASGATVENGPATAAISLQQSSTVTIQSDALLSAAGASPAGVTGLGGNTLTNRGNVIVSGSGASGINLGDGSTFTNESTGQVIVAPGIVGGPVVGVRGGSNSLISNAGLVRAFGDGSVAIQTATGTQVTNTGLVSAPGAGSAGIGLGQTSIATNDGTIEATGDGGIGVRLAGTNAGLINAGTITGGSGTGAAVLMLVPGTSTAPNQLRNDPTGVLDAASGIAVTGSSGVDVVDNRGTITGDVRLGSGNDTFFWGTGSTLTGALDGQGGTGDLLRLFQTDAATPVDDSFDLGATAGFEELQIGNPGDESTWTLTGAGSYANGAFLSSGTAVFADGASLANDLTVQAGELRLGDGTSFTDISVTGGSAVFESGASTQADVAATGGRVVAQGTSSLVGTLDLDTGSRFVAGFDAMTNDRLDVQGSVELRGGRLLLLNQSSTPASQAGPFRVLSATDGLTGEFGEIGSAFTRGTASYGPTSGASFVDVVVESSYTLPASSPNQRRVGHHLDLASESVPSSAFSAFLDALDALEDVGAGSQALDALHPELFDAHTSASFATASTYAGLLAERPLRCEQFVSPYRPNQPSQTPCGERGITPWATGFGRYADRSGDSNHRDWSYAGGGLALGADWRGGSGVVLSGLLGTSRVGLDFDGDGDGSFTSFELGLGAGWEYQGTYVRGALGYGHGWHTTHRQVDVPGFSRLALSDHDSDRVTALLEAGHEFVFTPFEVEPLVSLEYTYLHEQSISESNAGVVDLEIDSRSNALFATHAGLRAGMALVKYAYAGPWLEWADGVWRPELEAAWRQVWNDYDRAFSSRLAGAPSGTPRFRTAAQDARYGADLGARVSFQPYGTSNTFELGYEAFVGDGTTVHTAIARVRIPF
jgi:uncharacterized protein with beta-barrel porin domain